MKSKGENVYHAQGEAKKYCEANKAAKMNVKVTHINLKMKNNKIVWNNYNNEKRSVNLGIRPYDTSNNKHCAAFTVGRHYQIFLCQKVNNQLKNSIFFNDTK